MNHNIALPFHRSALAHAGRLALTHSGTSLTYGELHRQVAALAAALRRAGIRRGHRVGLLASRSVDACAAVLATAWCGAAYVPVSLKLPEDRILKVLDLSQFSALIVDAGGMKLLSPRVIEAAPSVIFLPDAEAARSLPAAPGRAILATASLTPDGEPDEPVHLDADEAAYIEFTSGTTGVPKGVVVSAGAVHHYVSAMQDRYHLRPEDRVAETTELSFDLSVSNMFTTWLAGASLHIVPLKDVAAPARFIRDSAITVWLSVPSVIAMMKRVKALRPNAFPSLRYSFFCGEPFPVSAAYSWREAAPFSIIDNLYGPTEATVWCVGQRFTDPPAVTPRREVLAIGTPIAGMQAAVVGPDLTILQPGEEGELALAGPQLAQGYFRAEDLTAARFPVIGGQRWYLTGDLAVQDGAGLFHHLGRIDNQIKVLGNRVELEDIEFHLRAVCGTELVAAVPWPTVNGTAEGLAAFVVAAGLEPAAIRAGLQARLPVYMVPSAIHIVDALPFNANGKLDRKALIMDLEQPKAA